ncbi:MAG: Gldg family protein, partial [Verrucomicrobiota bacterium]
MDAEPTQKPSFSPWDRWKIGLNVTFVVVVVLSVVVMVNYLSREYFLRLHLSSRTKNTLSSRTEHFLSTLTNQIKITLYYSKDDGLYTTVADLLNEYALANPHISLRTVDHLRDPSSAQLVKAEYKLNNTGDKNLVIFECEGRRKIVDG